MQLDPRAEQALSKCRVSAARGVRQLDTKNPTTFLSCVCLLPGKERRKTFLSSNLTAFFVLSLCPPFLFSCCGPRAPLSAVFFPFFLPSSVKKKLVRACTRRTPAERDKSRIDLASAAAQHTRMSHFVRASKYRHVYVESPKVCVYISIYMRLRCMMYHRTVF